jgi:hypothetical protein
MSTTNETLALIKAAQADDIAKAGVVAGSGQTAGFQNWNLEPAAKNLYPVTTKLRNVIPRVSNDNGGVGSNYKVITGYGAHGEIGVAEGARGFVQTPTLVDKVAYFRSLGNEGSVTFESKSATRGFDDVLASETQRVLVGLMEQEEKMIVAGRGVTALPAPTGLAAAASAGGALAAGNYSLIVRALTAKGAEFSSVSLGVTLPAPKPGADGTVMNRSGYAGTSATLAVNGITLNQKVTASVEAVSGAAAYAWFFGAAGSERLVAVTTLSTTEITALNAGGQLHSALPAGDFSVDSFAFDGLLTIASDMSPFNVALSGSASLSGSNGHIDQLDNVLQNMYDGIRVAADRVLVSTDMMAAVNKKILDGSNIRIAQSAEQTQGGNFVTTYIHPVTGDVLRVESHPFLPKGTILVYSTQLGYMNTNIPNVFQIKTNREYNQIFWPLRSRKYEFGVYVEEVLQHYLPSSMAVISNIKA